MTTLDDIRKQEYETPEGVWVKDGAPPPGIAPLEQPETGLADPSEVAPQKQFQTPEQMGMQTYKDQAPQPAVEAANPYLADLERDKKYESPAEMGLQEYKPKSLPPLTDDEKKNPYIVDNRKLEEKGELQGYDYQTRLSLNATSSFYTGTTNGASYLYALKNDMNDPSRDPKEREKDREKYDRIMDSLLNYDRMKGFDGPVEATIALTGQIAGSLPTAESLLPGGGLGVNAVRRMLSAGATQAGINVATDPIVQAFNIKTGVQDEFSFERLGTSAAIGTVLGGGLQGVAEVATKLGAPSKTVEPAAKPEAKTGEALKTGTAETAGATQGAMDSVAKIQEDASFDKAELNKRAVEAKAALEQGGMDAVAELAAKYKKLDSAAAEVPVKAEQRALPTEAEMAAHIMDEARLVEDTRLAAAVDVPGLLAVGETAKVAPETVTADVQFRTKAQAAAQPELGTGPQAPNAKQVISLQEQGQKLLDTLGADLHQGRLQGRGTVGQLSQGIVRVKSVADVATIAHEAGHFIEAKLGKPLTDLTTKHTTELSSFGNKTVAENYAEFVNWYVTAPAWAERNAPDFAKAFDAFLADGHKDIQDALLGARQAFDDYHNAPSGVALDAIVKEVSPETVLTRLKKDGIYPTVRNVLRIAYTGFMDRRAPIHFAFREMSRMIRDASGTLPDIRGHDNPAILAKQFDAGMGAANAALRDGTKRFGTNTREGASITDAISFAIGTPKWLGKWDEALTKQFNNYLTAIETVERWKHVDSGKEPVKPTARTREEAPADLADLDARFPKFRQAADMVKDFNAQQWRRAFEASIITREQYDAGLATDYYTPLYRVMDERAGDGGHTASASGDFVKHATGSDRDVIAPIQGIIMKTFMLERKIAHNEVLKSFLRLGDHARAAGAINVGTIIEDVPMTEVVGKNFDLAKGIRSAASKHGLNKRDTEFLVSTASDMFGDDPMLGTMFHHKPTQARGEPIAFVLDGGKERAVRLATGADKSGLALYETVMGLSEPLRAKWIDICQHIGQASASMVRAGVTAHPAYGIANLLRDQFMAAMISPGYIPFYGSARGMYHDIMQTSVAKMYAESGGISPGTAAYDLKATARNDMASLAAQGWVVKRLGSLDDLAHGRIGKAAGGAFKAYLDTLALAETGTRISVFESALKRGKKQGLSDYTAMWEAAATARDIMDFGRHGSAMETFSKVLPFLNSMLQGSEKLLWRAPLLPLVREAAGAIEKTGLANPVTAALAPVTKGEQREVGNAGIMLGTFSLSALAGYMYYHMTSDSALVRDREPEVRAKNIIFDGAWFGMPGLVVYYPKPFEGAIFWNAGEAMAQAEEGDARWKEHAMAGILGLVAPPSLIPPLFKIPMEAMLGKTLWKNREIVPEDVTQRLQQESQASSLSKIISEASGRVGVTISPLTVDYLVGAQFATVGRDLLSATNAANPDAPANDWDKAVLLQRFIKTEFGSGSNVTQQFWELASTRTGAFAEAVGKYNYFLQHEEDKEKALKFVAALPENQRVYVQLASEGKPDYGMGSKPLYNSGDRQLHPLTRARDACDAIKDTIVELTENKQTAKLDPGQRRNMISELERLQGWEQRNALVILQEPGFTKRELAPVDAQFDVIRSISPTTGDELARRYRTNNVLQTETIAKLWPDVKESVMRGENYTVRSLSYDAKADGYQFNEIGAVRVKEEKPVRVPMATAPEMRISP